MWIFDNTKYSALTFCAQTAKIWSPDTKTPFKSDPTEFKSAQLLQSADIATAETFRLVLTQLLAYPSVQSALTLHYLHQQI
jgi:hypothetical protein